MVTHLFHFNNGAFVETPRPRTGGLGHVDLIHEGPVELEKRMDVILFVKKDLVK